MKFLVLTRNMEDKTYRITGVYVNDSSKSKYEKVLREFNNNLFLKADGELCRNEYDEMITVKKWRDAMELIDYKESPDCKTPELN